MVTLHHNFFLLVVHLKCFLLVIIVKGTTGAISLTLILLSVSEINLLVLLQHNRVPLALINDEDILGLLHLLDDLLGLVNFLVMKVPGAGENSSLVKVVVQVLGSEDLLDLSLAGAELVVLAPELAVHLGHGTDYSVVGGISSQVISTVKDGEWTKDDAEGSHQVLADVGVLPLLLG